MLSPALEGLPPGLRGFHVHEHPDCSPGEDGDERGAAAAAGGHFDPDESGYHDGPWGSGHRGDLPALRVDDSGWADHPVLAPRLTPARVSQRALVVHAGGHTYSDEPEDGGGGDRIACGVID